PTLAEEQRVPHRLYGHINAAETYSVGRWCGEAGAVLADIGSDGPAIIVGGTGLYFNALTRGLAKMPPIPADIRDAVRGRLLSEGVAALYADLTARDAKAAARLQSNDRARIARALEVVLATGRSILDWQGNNEPAPVALAAAAKIFLMPEGDEMARRIDRRFDAMMAAGALDEVRALAARKLGQSLPPMKAHGVPWLIRHLAGDVTLAEAIAHAKLETRQYTKRQATWFRNQLPEFEWVAPPEAQAAIESQLRTIDSAQT
ncbi:MAG: tRNA (adenosine(37)-N6)-dimethylallyltransferase MiaA, partial [Xanthobacteraceae bacterium]